MRASEEACNKGSWAYAMHDHGCENERGALPAKAAIALDKII
jgi:hypothetical protein